MVGGWQKLGLLEHALAWLLYRRLGLVCRRMERLAARFLAGKVFLPRARVTRVAGGSTGVRVWPGRWAWLVRVAGWHAAGYGSQLAAVLGTPDMVALLRAAPQAGRMLKPICRMLAVDTALLRPQADGSPGAVVVAVVRERVPRVRGPRVPVDWGRIPLPRGVLAAARRQGFGKVPQG